MPYIGYNPPPSPVSTIDIQAGAIANTDLSVGAVTSHAIAIDAVTTAKIEDDAVTTAKIEDDAVTAAKILSFSGSLGGTVNGDDNVVNKINLKDYGEITNVIGTTGGGDQNIDLELRNSVTATVDTSTNTFIFINPTDTTELCSFTLGLTNGGSQTVGWPSSVYWAGGTAPALTPAGVDWLEFWTVDGGIIWNGALVGTAFA